MDRLTLKMGAVRSFWTLVNTYQSIQHKNAEEVDLSKLCCKNLKHCMDFTHQCFQINKTYLLLKAIRKCNEKLRISNFRHFLNLLSRGFRNFVKPQSDAGKIPKKYLQESKEITEEKRDCNIRVTVNQFSKNFTSYN